MADLNAQNKHPRRIWVAVMFSLIMPGLGQVYCGRLKRGLILTFLNILPLPTITGLFYLSSSPMLMQAVIGLILTGGIVQLAALLDSAYLAKRAGAEYQLNDCNSPLVYVLLVLIVTGGSIGSSLYLRDRALEAFRVPTASCYPTILPNDRILANKSVYQTNGPQRGDLVVHICPENRHSNYIKRVVALAGDTVEVRDGRLYINGKELPRRELPASTPEEIRIQAGEDILEGRVFEETNGNARYRIFSAGPPDEQSADDFEKTAVPEHHCFVLGDNRNLSRDSRHFGPVHLGLIKGRADYLYFPAKDWSRFGKIR
ncbi:MAG: signal peptidase I [Phycisphaerales bacterium]|nr:MAG: signal peptidase I [Phycisphaerales bacterium]